MAFLAVMEKGFRMFFCYPLRVVRSVLVGLIFLVQFVYFGEAILGGRYSPSRLQRGSVTTPPTPS